MKTEHGVNATGASAPSTAIPLRACELQIRCVTLVAFLGRAIETGDRARATRWATELHAAAAEMLALLDPHARTAGEVSR